MSDRTNAYAASIVAIGNAEGQLAALTDELRTIADAIDGNADLRNAVTDPSAPVGRRLALLETSVLAAASTATKGALAQLLATGRVDHIGEIAHAVAELAAAGKDRELAEVTVAVDLDEQRRAALLAALEAVTGKRLDLQVVVDPTVVGGVRAIVGDTVYDGSLARRLDDIRTRVGA